MKVSYVWMAEGELVLLKKNLAEAEAIARSRGRDLKGDKAIRVVSAGLALDEARMLADRLDRAMRVDRDPPPESG